MTQINKQIPSVTGKFTVFLCFPNFLKFRLPEKSKNKSQKKDTNPYIAMIKHCLQY